MAYSCGVNYRCQCVYQLRNNEQREIQNWHGYETKSVAVIVKHLGFKFNAVKLTKAASKFTNIMHLRVSDVSVNTCSKPK